MSLKKTQRTYSVSPLSNINLTKLPLASLNKLSKNNNAKSNRALTARNTNSPLGFNGERVQTESAQGGRAIITDTLLFEKHNLNDIPTQIKKFDEFLQQNGNRLSENSLKYINYDTIDQLTNCITSSRSTLHKDEQRNKLLNLDGLVTDPKSPEGINPRKTSLGNSNDFRNKHETDDQRDSKNKKVLLKALDVKESVNSRMNRPNSFDKGTGSIIQKEKKSLGNMQIDLKKLEAVSKTQVLISPRANKINRYGTGLSLRKASDLNNLHANKEDITTRDRTNTMPSSNRALSTEGYEPQSTQTLKSINSARKLDEDQGAIAESIQKEVGQGNRDNLKADCLQKDIKDETIEIQTTTNKQNIVKLHSRFASYGNLHLDTTRTPETSKFDTNFDLKTDSSIRGNKYENQKLHKKTGSLKFVKGVYVNNSKSSITNTQESASQQSRTKSGLKDVDISSKEENQKEQRLRPNLKPLKTDASRILSPAQLTTSQVFDEGSSPYKIQNKDTLDSVSTTSTFKKSKFSSVKLSSIQNNLKDIKGQLAPVSKETEGYEDTCVEDSGLSNIKLLSFPLIIKQKSPPREMPLNIEQERSILKSNNKSDHIKGPIQKDVEHENLWGETKEHKDIRTSDKNDHKTIEKKVVSINENMNQLIEHEDEVTLKKVESNSHPMFNFKKKNVNTQFKKTRSFNRRSSEAFSTKTQPNHNQAKFLEEFNKIIQFSPKKLQRSLTRNTEQTGSFSQVLGPFIRRKSDQNGFVQLEELLNKHFEDDGGLSRGLTRALTQDVDKLLRLNTLDIEVIAAGSKPQVRILNEICYSQGKISDKEIQNKWSSTIKSHSYKDGVITVNINPPIEEASPHMEESVFPSGSTANNVDGNELVKAERNEANINNNEVHAGTLIINQMSSANSLTKIKQYKFELSNRKFLEEQLEGGNEFFEDLEVNDQINIDQSFRLKAENLFNYDGTDYIHVEDLNNRSLTINIKSNFFTFLEKIVANPTSSQGHKEYIEQASSDDLKRSSIIRCNSLFKYVPKTEEAKFGFLNNFLFRQEIIRHLHLNIDLDLVDVDDNSEYDESIIKSQNRKLCVFDTSELSEFFKNRTELQTSPVLVSMDRNTIFQICIKFPFQKLFMLKFGSCSINNLDSRVDTASRILTRMNDANWNFVTSIIRNLYQSMLIGSFETKLFYAMPEASLERKDSLTGSPRRNILKKERTFKRRPTANKSKLANAILATVKKRASKTFKQAIRASNIITFMAKSKQNEMSPSNTINEREEKEENEDNKVSFIPNFNMASKGPRRYSKTTIKPFVSMMNKEANLEKCKTAVPIEKVPTLTKSGSNVTILSNRSQVDTLPDPLMIPKVRTKTTASEEETNETSHQLQIPYRSHTTKLQSPVNKDDNNRSILGTERGTRRNNITISNTSNSSAQKSLSPVSDINQNSTTGQTTIYLNTNPNNNFNKTGKPEPVQREKSARSLTTRQISDTKTENAEQTSRLNIKPKEEQSSSQSPKPYITKITKKILGVNPTLRRLPTTRIRKDGRKSTQAMNPKQALFFAAYNSDCQQLLEALDIYPREFVNIRDENENSLLMIAAKNGNRAMIRMLIDKRIDINAQNADGDTALHLCLQFNQDEAADLLISNGIKQTIRNKRGKTAWEEVN